MKKISDLITISSQKLIDVITDVIEISQIHTNQIKVRKSEFDIILLINKMIDKFNNLVRVNNIDISFDFNWPQNEYLIFTDKEKLERVIFHLIDNAIKFTLQGSVKIYLKSTSSNIEISVSDTGIGISNEIQELIFEPFRQAETGNARKFGGNGLGLAIIKSYTELLDGTINLKSEINIGSKFEISIPLLKQDLKMIKPEMLHKKSTITTILIVEDEYSNYQYLLEVLENSNFKILYAENGQRALDICQSNLTIDLVLMDIKMPVMDGHTATKILKKFRPNLPIIAQTAYALDSEKDNFIGVFDDYITKPIDEGELFEKLKKYIYVN